MTEWSQIINECGNYKAGFVAVFHKYEGALTDEKDRQGRRVKVTARSFAEHMGIPPQTFRDWLSKSTGVVPQPRPPSYLARDVKRAAKSEPSSVVDGIMAAGVAATDQVLQELQLRMAGHEPNRADRTKAGRKAREADKAERSERFKHRMLGPLYIDFVIASLESATEDVRNAVKAGQMNSDAEQRINAALEEFQFALAEARFKMS